MSPNDTLDLVWGAEQIGLLINRTEREVFYLLATHQLKGARKVGGRWVINRQALTANFGSSTPFSPPVEASLLWEFDMLMRQLSPEEQREVFEYWT